MPIATLQNQHDNIGNGDGEGVKAAAQHSDATTGVLSRVKEGGKVHSLMCVDLCAEGCCSCRTPFNIYEPGKHSAGQEVGQVVKVWSGLATEVFTDADKFELRFPANADGQTKTRLLGTTFLLNQLFFEERGSGGGPGPQ